MLVAVSVVCVRVCARVCQCEILVLSYALVFWSNCVFTWSVTRVFVCVCVCVCVQSA